MKKVYLSDSGPLISEAIYSFWRWNDQENLTLEKVKEIINYSLELGINAFDVSPLYGNGQIEKLFGDSIQNLNLDRKDIVVFTKIGIKQKQSDGSIRYEELTEKSIKEQLENSLINLKSEYVDVVLIQDFDPLMKVDVVASALTSLQLRGKIKHIGVSNFNVQQHKLLESRLNSEVVTNHFELNLLNTLAIKDGRLDFIKENYSKPMAFGPLVDGKILYGQEKESIIIRSVLEGLTQKYNSNIEQLAVSWIHKLGALPIIGSLSKERIKNAATANEINLSHEDWHKIYNVINS